MLTVGSLVAVPSAAGASLEADRLSPASGASSSAVEAGPPAASGDRPGPTEPPAPDTEAGDRGRSPGDPGKPDDPGKSDDEPGSDPGPSGGERGAADGNDGPDPADEGTEREDDGNGGVGSGSAPDGAGDRGEGADRSGPVVEVRVRGSAGDRPGFPDRAPTRSPTGTPGSSVVDVTVEGVEPGDSMSIDVSPTAVEAADVTFDAVTVTVERGGGFTMAVLSSREALPGSPLFDAGPGTEPLGRIRLEHSIDNADVDDVGFGLRVSRARLREAGVDPEAVTLYRFADGEWTGLPTDVVGETATHYLLETDSPGFSEFAVGSVRPSFETRRATVDRSRAALGERVRVAALISNVGGADGTVDVELVVGERVVENRQLTIAAGGTRQVTFSAPMERGGTHRVFVDGVYAGSVTVTGAPDRDPTSSLTRRIDSALDRLLRIGRAFGGAVNSPRR